MRPIDASVARLQEERDQLKGASSLLAGLTRRRDACAAELHRLALLREESTGALGSIRAKLELAEQQRIQAQEVLEGLEPAQRERCFPQLEALAGQQPSQRTLTVESAANWEQDLRRFLQDRIDAADKRITRLVSAIISAMKDSNT